MSHQSHHLAQRESRQPNTLAWVDLFPGVIPNELAKLTALNALTLSCNKIRGEDLLRYSALAFGRRHVILDQVVQALSRKRKDVRIG